MIKYRILSPDGFDISPVKTEYKEKEIQEAIQMFINRYITQGYYSQTCYNGYRRQIPVDALPDYIDIIKI